MNYKNYDDQIVAKYCVRLIGWPLDKFCNPSELSTISEATLLLRALQTQACRWERLTRKQAVEHIEDVEARRTAGEKIGRKRKRRSDKDKVRGAHSKRKGGNQKGDEAGNDEDEE